MKSWKEAEFPYHNFGCFFLLHLTFCDNYELRFTARQEQTFNYFGGPCHVFTKDCIIVKTSSWLLTLHQAQWSVLELVSKLETDSSHFFNFQQNEQFLHFFLSVSKFGYCFFYKTILSSSSLISAYRKFSYYSKHLWIWKAIYGAALFYIFKRC